MRDPWKCGPCKRLNKHSAFYCGACGVWWEQCWDKTYMHRTNYAMDGSTPRGSNHRQGWNADGWDQRPKSPRKRSTTSPRRQGKGEAKGKGKAKDGNVTRQASKWPMPVLDWSSVKEEAILEPVPPRTQMPTKSAESSAEVQDLISTLQASYPDGLPPELQAKVDKIKKTSPMDLRRHIGQMTKVKKELDALREARKRHVDAWKHHVESLVKNTSAQLAQYKKVIQDFAACEDDLTQQFQAARTSILQITQQSKPADEDLQALNAVDAMMSGGTAIEPINVEEEANGDAMEAARVQQIQSSLSACVASLAPERERSRSRGRDEQTVQPAIKNQKVDLP